MASLANIPSTEKDPLKVATAIRQATEKINGIDTLVTSLTGLGEYISSTVASGSAVSLTTSTAADITTISLTAGDWDVSAVGYSNPSLGNVSDFRLGLSTTANTLPSFSTGDGRLNIRTTGGADLGTTVMPVGPARFELSSTTTIRMVGFAVFGAGTVSMFGTLRARRVTTA